MALVFYSESDSFEPWRDALTEAVPDLTILDWDQVEDPAAIDYALVWTPPRGSLRKFPNLKVIINLGAGVDALLKDPDLPPGVPIVRMVDDDLAKSMGEYVLLHVLRYHREQPLLEAQQRAREWRINESPTARDCCVGIMGLGSMGGEAARNLVGIGFDVASWTRSPRPMEGVQGFHGQDGLGPFLARSDILVCLLPLTPETEGILSKKLFDRLPEGAYLINAGRGGHQVEADILEALDSGQLGGATLDVFNTEPLPSDSPLWTHPGITVTPHSASIALPGSAVRHVADTIRRVRSGEPLRHVVDPGVGY